MIYIKYHDIHTPKYQDNIMMRPIPIKVIEPKAKVEVDRKTCFTAYVHHKAEQQQ